jgi:hypothetical protein
MASFIHSAVADFQKESQIPYVCCRDLAMASCGGIAEDWLAGLHTSSSSILTIVACGVFTSREHQTIINAFLFETASIQSHLFT